MNGHVVVNENVLRIQRLARALGGRAYSDPSGRTITIESRCANPPSALYWPTNSRSAIGKSRLACKP
ncbi:MAG TPA: hypothetical protein VGL99_28465, partial [Chloroflexota bacterium]